MWDMVTRIWRKARQTKEVVTAPRFETWGQGVDIRAIGKYPECDKTDAQWNTWRLRLETCIALITRAVDELPRSTTSSMAVMTNPTDRGTQYSSVLYAALVGVVHVPVLTAATRAAHSRGLELWC